MFISFFIASGSVEKVFAVLSNKCITKVGEPSEAKTPGCEGSQPPKTPAPACPNNNCPKAVLDEFGITISANLPSEYSRYAWEKLWNVRYTNFDDLVRGTFVKAVFEDPDPENREGSHRKENAIYLRSIYPQSFFDIIFVHELSHFINDLPDPTSRRTDHDGVFKNELEDGHRGVTGYGELACTYENPTDNEKREEDYADMLAYYLNPGVIDQTSGIEGCNRGVVPYANGKYPNHFKLAQDILGAY